MVVTAAVSDLYACSAYDQQLMAMDLHQMRSRLSIIISILQEEIIIMELKTRPKIIEI